MREVTIPADTDPYIVIVNTMEYSYPAGETLTVPDEVADIIDQYNAAKPEIPAPMEWVDGLKYDPDNDAGKALKIKEGGIGLEWG